jgi:ABC-type molybdate transport system substrate-binding protein
MRFIIKTVCGSLILLIGYNLMLFYFPGTQNQSSAQGFWQKNKIKAESYSYHHEKYNAVIVGSSMSEGLSLKQQFKNTTTLNFVGGSSVTALDIIKRTNKLPKVIIIETNWMDRPIYNELIENVTNKNFTLLKSFVPSFLEANQPSNVLCHIFKIKKSLCNK